jgi:CheY-like chemotaxis protein
MIHVLVVAPEGPVGGLALRRSSVEVLHARDAEEAVEKLARNRRVDAVLLLAGAENASVARAIREDNLSPPPLFAPASAGEIPGVRSLPDGDPERMLDLVDRTLAGA